MARKITIPSQDYIPQTLTRFVDQVPGKPRGLLATFTRESWPGTKDDIVLKVTAQWRDGPGVTVGLPGGVALDKQGQVITVHPVFFSIPPVRKQDFLGADFTLEIVQGLRTGITVEVLV